MTKRERAARDLALVRAARAGDRAARGELVESKLRLLEYMARRRLWYVKARFQLEDLVQEAYFGLDRAIDLYREDCGISFAWFATRSIRKALDMAIRNQGCLIRVPQAWHGPAPAPSVRRVNPHWREYWADAQIILRSEFLPLKEWDPRAPEHDRDAAELVESLLRSLGHEERELLRSHYGEGQSVRTLGRRFRRHSSAIKEILAAAMEKARAARCAMA